MIIDKFDGLFLICKSWFHEIFLNAMKTMQIACIEDGITNLSPSEVEEAPSIADLGHSIDNIPVNIPFELLREVFEESCAVQTDISPG